MKIFNRQTGRIGEAAAEDYLSQRGYKTLVRNFRTKFGEIDLIMEKDQITVFVEVKTKVGLSFGSPEEMFGRGKYERVKRMATLYLNDREIPCRIDMIAIVLDVNYLPISINHYPEVSF